MEEISHKKTVKVELSPPEALSILAFVVLLSLIAVWLALCVIHAAPAIELITD